MGSAVEGAAFGANNVVNEAVLGDPEEAAQHALSEIGTSALWGAGLGSALGVAKHVIPASVGAAKDAAAATADSLGLSSLTGRLVQGAKEGYATVASVASGVPKEDILAAIMNRGTEAGALDTEEIAGNLQKHYSTLESVKKTALQDIRPEEIEKLVGNVAPEAALNEAGKTYGALDNAIQTMREEPELYPPSYARQLELIRDSVPKIGAEGAAPADVFNSLNDLKRNLDTKIPYEKIPSAASQNAISLIKDLRGQVKDSLENEDVWGPAGARQAQFNDALSDYLKSVNSAKQSGEFAKNFMVKSGGALKIDPVKVETFLKNTQTTRGLKSAQALTNFIDSSNKLLNQVEESYKSLPDQSFDKGAVQDLIERNQGIIEQNKQQAILNRMSKGADAGGSQVEPLVAGAVAHSLGLSHPVVGAIFGAAEALRYPGQTIQRLAKLEEAINKTQQKIVRGAKVLASGVDKAAPYLKGYAASKMSQADFSKTTKQIQDLANNPQSLMDKFNENTSALTPHAPNTSVSLQATGARAISFLASKIMQKPSQGPLAPEIEPSKAEIAEFNKYYSAVDKPLTVLKEAAAGTLTHQGIEVLTNVYPALYNSIKESVTKELMNVKKPIPYSRRMMLSLLMGADMDSTMQPQNIISNQQLLGVSAAQQQAKDQAFAGAGKVRAKGWIIFLCLQGFKHQCNKQIKGVPNHGR